MENVFILTAIAGVVEFGRRVEIKDYRAALTIVAAAVVGGLAGGFDLGGLTTVESGVIAGISASGLVTVATRVG